MINENRNEEIKQTIKKLDGKMKSLPKEAPEDCRKRDVIYTNEDTGTVVYRVMWVSPFKETKNEVKFRGPKLERASPSNGFMLIGSYLAGNSKGFAESCPEIIAVDRQYRMECELKDITETEEEIIIPRKGKGIDPPGYTSEMNAFPVYHTYRLGDVVFEKEDFLPYSEVRERSMIEPNNRIDAIDKNPTFFWG